MSAIGIAGSKIFMGTFAAAKAFSSISNASEAVLSFAADPALVATDIFKIDGGWSEVAGNIYRAKSPSGSGPYLVTAEGFDASSSSLYPAGTGAGNIYEAGTWTQITQVKDEGGITSNGGELSFKEYGFLEVGRKFRQPDVRSPSGLTVACYEDTSLSWYATVLAASKNRGVDYPFYILLPNGSKVYFSAYVSLKEVPDFQDYLETSLDLSIVNGFTRYSA
jgi:hypothetical protein